MARRDEGVNGIAQRTRVKQDVWVDDEGQVVDQAGAVVGLTAAQTAAAQALVSGAWIQPHPRYWFHGAAVGHTADEAVFRDLVGGNHATMGANLSKAQAWANAGYVSTVDPASGVTDSVLRIPAPNWSYMAQESLLLMWAGQITPEGSDTDIMGTSGSTAANGIRLRCTSAGRLTFSMYDTAPTSRFGTTTTDTAAGKPFVAGERHTFALFIDAVNRLQYIWVDGLINVNAFALSSGADVDTLSAATWNIGTAAPLGGAVTTTGCATKTQAFAGLKFPSDELPTETALTAAAQAFHRAPQFLIAKGAL